MTLPDALQKGAVYRFDHTRKGVFVGRVVDLDDEWAEVEVVEGEAHLKSSGGNAGEGERVRLRLSLTKWKRLAAQPPSHNEPG